MISIEKSILEASFCWPIAVTGVENKNMIDTVWIVFVVPVGTCLVYIISSITLYCSLC